MSPADASFLVPFDRSPTTLYPSFYIMKYNISELFDNKYLSWVWFATPLCRAGGIRVWRPFLYLHNMLCRNRLVATRSLHLCPHTSPPQWVLEDALLHKLEKPRAATARSFINVAKLHNTADKQPWLLSSKFKEEPAAVWYKRVTSCQVAMPNW